MGGEQAGAGRSGQGPRTGAAGAGASGQATAGLVPVPIPAGPPRRPVSRGRVVWQPPARPPAAALGALASAAGGPFPTRPARGWLWSPPSTARPGTPQPPSPEDVRTRPPWWDQQWWDLPGPTAGPPSMGGCQPLSLSLGWGSCGDTPGWGGVLPRVSVCPRAVPPGCGAHGGCWSPRCTVGIGEGTPHGHIPHWGQGGDPSEGKGPTVGGPHGRESSVSVPVQAEGTVRRGSLHSGGRRWMLGRGPPSHPERRNPSVGLDPMATGGSG